MALHRIPVCGIVNPSSRPIVCLVTDRRRLAPEVRTVRAELAELDRLLDEAIAAGVDLVQVRERDLDAAVLVAFVRGLVRRAAGTTTRVVVNERTDVAIASGADGVHLRSDGPPADRLRALAPGDEWIVGRSCHAVDAARVASGADYVLFGTVFGTASKPGAPASGLDALARWCASTSVPVVAIGGLTPERADACAAAGAAGVAAIGAFLPEGRRPDAIGPRRAVPAFREALARGMAARGRPDARAAGDV
jgi:thiamine-phosphate pyrophosphorylase